MYHPSSERASDEWIELRNTGGSAVNLERWSLARGVAFTFPAVTIPAGGYLVVAAERAAFAAKYPGVTNIVAGWTGRLSNSGDLIALRDDKGAIIDEVDYADSGDWGRRERDDADFGYRGWRWRSEADGYGKSLELINAAFDNNSGQNWGASIKGEGTPGEPNSIAAADIAPVIRAVRHFPLVPAADQAVTVTATVVDDRGAAIAVTVAYRKDGAVAWTTLPMLDDGAHNDGAAGDRVFGAQLPAQADGSIVEFYIAATDGALRRTWPAPALNNAAAGDAFVTEQSQNCLYQVDSKAYFGAMPICRLVLKAADRATLAAINEGDGKESHARFNATFISMDGTGRELRYLAGVRNRGHGSADLQPQSFNVTVPADARWKGRSSLNLNSQYTYLQLLGSGFFRRAGLPAAESRAVQVRVNNLDPTGGIMLAPSYGFYVCNEVQDSDFTARQFPTDGNGNLYSVRRFESVPFQEGDLSHYVPAGLNGADPYRPVYFKETNASEDDWGDLIGLTRALAKGRFTTLAASPSWDDDYVAAVQSAADLDQWLAWFAVQALIGNGESNLSNGHGDDFSVYFGATDRRARLVPHDLDTVLGGGDSPASATADLFPMIRHGWDRVPVLTPTPLYPLLRHPAIGPRYFAKLQELLAGPLSIANVHALADQVLSGVVSPLSIERRKAWYASRHAYVSGRVSPRLGVTSGPAVDVTTGYARTTTARCSLAGKSDPARTQGVKVNGVAATYVPWRVDSTTAETNSHTVAIGEWSLADVALQPGVNRLLLQAFDAAGNEIERAFHEVWFDDGSVAEVSGSIAANTTWTAAGGPYHLTAPVTIASGATLTIEPGVSIYLAPGVGLTVAAGGRLLAEGTEAAPIYFTRRPGATDNGGTLTINGAPGAPETRLRHVFFNFGGRPAVACTANSNVVLEHCEWLRTDVAYLHLDGGSFLVSNCVFPSASANSFFESIHGEGATPAGGRAIIRDSFFGKTHSTPGNYNDVIDFTGGNRPGPILQIYNNIFLGSDDDILDIDGTDAWIEGNIFMHVHRANSPDSASAVSGGEDSGRTSELTVVGNLFYDVDQAVTVKQGNFLAFLNNTVVDQNSRGSDERREDIVGQPNVFLPAVLNVSDHGSPAARGFYAEGNVIHSAEKLVRNFTGAEAATFNNNLFPPDLVWTGSGSGNTSAAALLSDVMVDPLTGASNIPSPTKDNYRRVAAEIRRQFGLDARSPARGTGPAGGDKGGVRPLGVTLGGAPTGITNATTATVTVGTVMAGSGIPAGANQFPSGAGWTHYKWRLDGGAWSAETPAATPISLTGLAAGPHTLEVVGKNDAGTFQDHPDLGGAARASSVTWRVDPNFVPPALAPIVRINEVLASNAATASFGTVFPDIIELANVGNAPADLGGWGLTDNAALPYKFTFPAGTVIAPGAFLVVYASGNAAVPSPRTGFALGAGGDDLTLIRSAAAGGGIADTVAWGQQVTDFSIGRMVDGSWALCRPTFGAANAPAALSPSSLVRITEWLADASGPGADDFIELHNPGTLPMDLGGHFLTDNPAGWPNRSPIAPLTFIPAGGHLVFIADGDSARGSDHTAFRLSPTQGEIGFVSPTRVVLDHVIYGPQRTGIAQGRPSGGGVVFTLMIPTPGVVNARIDADFDGDGLPDVWEIAHGFDPRDPADALLDADGDGVSNRSEFVAGTNPRDAADFRLPQSGAVASRMINLSVLAPLSAGEVMTVGAVIGGAGTSGSKALVARAAGPALTQFGLGGVLPDPKIALFGQGGVLLASNGDWAGDQALRAVFAQVGAFPLGDAASKDAGIFQPALAAANYTVQVSDAGAGVGNVIVELYDATPSNAVSAVTPRLINVSVLKRIAAGSALTVGFVIEGTAPKTVLLRAIGPTLGAAPFGIAGAMADPRLELFAGAAGGKIGENNDWAGSAALSASFAAVGAFAPASPATKDAAMLASLAPGQYSAQVRSADAGEGLVIVEVYEVP